MCYVGYPYRSDREALGSGSLVDFVPQGLIKLLYSSDSSSCLVLKGETFAKPQACAAIIVMEFGGGLVAVSIGVYCFTFR